MPEYARDRWPADSGSRRSGFAIPGSGLSPTGVPKIEALSMLNPKRARCVSSGVDSSLVSSAESEEG
ncbi:MAG: hypothetical protein CL908_23375 [Deltaproteobacteria bacterium]|nr:hypothetical protein [Deltaproteobacteria bacterium]